ncbi:MAG: hypothetical protein J0I93_00135 [Legionella sp.]|nr:hypothetical protein [Legionella sp.]
MESRVELNQSGYLQACKNIEDGKNWMGMAASGESELSDAHPLIVLIYELSRLVVDKNELTCFKITHPQKLAIEEINTCLKKLRVYIQAGIELLSSKELLDLRVDLQRYQENTLLEFLGEIGETGLFKLVHNKLAPYLNAQDYLKIYFILTQSYEGSRLSESLGLGLSLVRRGKPVYVQLMNYLFSQLNQEKKEEFMSLLANTPGGIVKVEDVRNEVTLDLQTFIRDSIMSVSDSTIDSDFEFDFEKKKAQLTRLYQEYVTANQGRHLMEELESNHFSMKSSSTNVSIQFFPNNSEEANREVKLEQSAAHRRCSIM